MSRKQNNSIKINSLNSSLITAKKREDAHSPYSRFDQLNGEHDWRDFVPEGYIDYQARLLKNGQVAYFNFQLAREMGLIGENHPNELSPQLKDKIIETFSLRIINEYDIQQGISFPKKNIKHHAFMATRYLQLQHSNKLGKTSGDGRCIWNGKIQYKGQTWDVSSRGTGVTALAPGSVEAGKPLQSGSEKYGYGCGLADLDELYGAVILAEIFHLSGVNTERVLAIIDIGNGHGIGVRAGKNLLRPAHIFLYLKQNNLDALKRAVDYLIIRQHRNKAWNFGIHHPRRYALMLKQLITHFAQFVAFLDRNYIFTWLDWDGDNVLATAGIIDYGSVRQFGLRHDQYRYDDVDRFSTSLNQQIPKARKMIQVFAQLVDYLESGKKKPFNHFLHHQSLVQFDHLVKHHLYLEWLKQLGFTTHTTKVLIRRHKHIIGKMYDIFCRLERKKVHRPVHKVADGINRSALMNMRKAIIYLLSFYQQQQHEEWAHKSSNVRQHLLSLEDLYAEILTEKASAKDRRLTSQIKKDLTEFHKYFYKILTLVSRETSTHLLKLIKQLLTNAQMQNKENRITGNGLIHIVDAIMTAKRKGASQSIIQKVIEEFIESQKLDNQNSLPSINNSSGVRKKLMEDLLFLVIGHKEDI